jgi:hypothetical protein
MEHERLRHKVGVQEKMFLLLVLRLLFFLAMMILLTINYSPGRG